MKENLYRNKENNLTLRERIMEEGQLFDAYQYRLKMGYGFKMIALSNFDGLLHVHECKYCKPWVPSQTLMRYAHFKVRVYNGTEEFSSTLTQYSTALRKEILSMKL